MTHGNASTNNANISIAHMIAPPKWRNQTPEFEEVLIISGKKQFIIEDEIIILEAGQSIKIEKTHQECNIQPSNYPCEYIAVCPL
jgi:mannose-6-phosphate isomerase-like protein (cupin superfamily)